MKISKLRLHWWIISVLLATSCSGPPPKFRHLLYDAVMPARQKDHVDSEMGQLALEESERTGALDKVGIYPTCEYPLRERKNIDPNSNIYLILQFDGGGIMGITPAALLEKLEASLRARNNFDGAFKDIVSICSGSSTGAILAGSVAAGIPAKDIARLYREDGFELYTGEGRLKKPKMFQFKLDREKFQDILFRQFENNSPYRNRHLTLKEMSEGPLLIIAAFDLVTERTIFLRTRNKFGLPINSCENIQLVDAISASAYSGAYVFGKIPNPAIETTHIQADGQLLKVKGAVFADGAQGTQNSTLSLAAIEALEIIQADPRSQVILVSMGCGNTFVDETNYSEKDKRRHALGLPAKPRDKGSQFHEVARFRELQEILATGISIDNQARGESIQLQLMAAGSIEATLRNPKGYSRLLVYRFDFEPLLPCGFPVANEVTTFHITETGREFLLDQAEKISRWDSFVQLSEILANPNVMLKTYRPAR